MASSTTAANADFRGYAGIHSTILAAMEFLDNLQPTDIDPILEGLHCVICSEPPSSPIQLPACGHVFCKACIMAWLTPFDREAPEPLTVEFVELPNLGNQIQEAAVGEPEMRSGEEETHGDEEDESDAGETKEEEDDEAKDEGSEVADPDWGIVTNRPPSVYLGLDLLESFDTEDGAPGWDSDDVFDIRSEADEDMWQRREEAMAREEEQEAELRESLTRRLQPALLNEQQMGPSNELYDINDPEQNHPLPTTHDTPTHHELPAIEAQLRYAYHQPHPRQQQAFVYLNHQLPRPTLLHPHPIPQPHIPHLIPGPNTCPLCRHPLFPPPSHGSTLLSLHTRLRVWDVCYSYLSLPLTSSEQRFRSTALMFLGQWQREVREPELLVDAPVCLGVGEMRGVVEEAVEALRRISREESGGDGDGDGDRDGERGRRMRSWARCVSWREEDRDVWFEGWGNGEGQGGRRELVGFDEGRFEVEMRVHGGR